jgi:microcystin-dependent protein
MHHIHETEDLIACQTLRIDVLEAWRAATVDPSLTSLGTRVDAVEIVVAALDIVGMVVPYAGSAAPGGWLLCDGSEISATTYVDLFAVLGYVYGGADDVFNVPDLRKQFVRGYDASLGAVGGTFVNKTAAPQNVAAIPTASGGVAHRHIIASGGLTTVAAHQHPVTVNAANAAHGHGGVVSSEPNHNHGAAPSYTLTGNNGSHAHYMFGTDSSPITAFPITSLPTPLPYAGNETIYETLDPTNNMFFLTRPNVYSATLQTSPTLAHAHELYAAGAHNHAITSDNAAHSHTATTADGGSHTHSGETSDATSLHTHTVSKTTGWDSETSPQHMLLNYIIKY